jgi:lipopolysaccharide export system protein LptA
MAITIDTQNARRAGRLAAVASVRVGQRARAFAAANRHSRLVAMLRVLLPLVALGIVGAYALAVAISVAGSIGGIKVKDIVITADDLTMKEPSYFDVTKDGRYEVRANRAVVAFSQNAPIKLIDVSGDLTQNNGTVTRLKAKHGLYEQKKGELELFDGIEIDGTNGIMARLSRAMFYSKESKVVTTEPVSATMPTGSVRAAAMTMHNKSKLVQFRGNVNVRLLPQQGQGLATGKDARQPVDIRAEELDIDDAAKAAHFKGKVVAVQGETMLQAPYLMVTYEGKAASGLAPAADASAGKDAAKDAGTRVTFLKARNGVEVTAGTDRRITSDLADFDIAADTALFAGKVVAVQEKNELKGGRLLLDRKAGKTRLETPGTGGIVATFHPKAAVQQRPAKRPSAAEEVQGSMLGSFKADKNAPMKVEASTLELLDASNKAVFDGNVKARQGEMELRTAELTAFFSGQGGMGFGSPPDGAVAKAAPKRGEKGQEKGEIVRMEARGGVVIATKDQATKDEQSATGQWADFNVKDNKAVLGGDVIVTRTGKDPAKPDVVKGERLNMDLTTGISQVEAAEPAAPQRPPPPPVVSASSPETPQPTPQERVDGCPPGRTCLLLHPQQAKERAKDVLKKKVPGINVP